MKVYRSRSTDWPSPGLSVIRWQSTVWQLRDNCLFRQLLDGIERIGLDHQPIDDIDWIDDIGCQSPGSTAGSAPKENRPSFLSGASLYLSNKFTVPLSFQEKPPSTGVLCARWAHAVFQAGVSRVSPRQLVGSSSSWDTSVPELSCRSCVAANHSNIKCPHTNTNTYENTREIWH